MKRILFCLTAMLLATSSFSIYAKDLNKVGISVSSLSNPYFVALVQGATKEAQKINPDVKIITVSSEYDLGKQFNQMDNFIAAGVDMIMVAAADPHAIAPAIAKAKAAGIPVVAVDVEAEGADATVETDNTSAGEISCELLANKLNGKGKVVIQWAGPTSASIARVEGCKKSLAKYQDITLLSDMHNTQCARDKGLEVMLNQLQRYPDLAGVFTICEQPALGANLAANQLHRNNIVITSVDGSPDAVQAIKSGTLIAGTASQDPRSQGSIGLQVGYGLMNGKKPENKIQMLTPVAVTPENVDNYKGW